MTASIQHHVNVSVSLAGTGPQPAGFGVPIFVDAHSVTANRLDGPFTSLADLTDAGWTTTSEAYLWARAVLQQQPRVKSLYVGRIDGADADIAESMDAILAEDPSAWYAATLGSRDDADGLAFAAWIEASTVPKIGAVQSSAASLLAGEGPAANALFEGTVADGTYILTFTGYGLASPVAITVTRTAGTPVTLADIAAAMRTALETAESGTLATVLVAGSTGGAGANASWRIRAGLASGTVEASGTAVASTADITITDTDLGIGDAFQRLQYTRTFLCYHAAYDEYLDGAIMSRCLAFDLDVRKGAWSYKRLVGVEGDTLTNTQAANLRSLNVNYFAPAAMTAGGNVAAFFYPGCMPAGDAGAGRRIDVTTSLDWLRARHEEAGANVLLRATHEVPFTDAGINQFVSAFNGVNAVGIAAGHLVRFEVPEGEEYEGTITPALFAPTLAQTTTAQRVARTFSITGIMYLRSSIERVNFSATARQ